MEKLLNVLQKGNVKVMGLNTKTGELQEEDPTMVLECLKELQSKGYNIEENIFGNDFNGVNNMDMDDDYEEEIEIEDVLEMIENLGIYLPEEKVSILEQSLLNEDGNIDPNKVFQFLSFITSDIIKHSNNNNAAGKAKAMLNNFNKVANKQNKTTIKKPIQKEEVKKEPKSKIKTYYEVLDFLRNTQCEEVVVSSITGAVKVIKEGSKLSTVIENKDYAVLLEDEKFVVDELKYEEGWTPLNDPMIFNEFSLNPDQLYSFRINNRDEDSNNYWKNIFEGLEDESITIKDLLYRLYTKSSNNLELFKYLLTLVDVK